jgi:hypothetical protein
VEWIAVFVAWIAGILGFGVVQRLFRRRMAKVA